MELFIEYLLFLIIKQIKYFQRLFILQNRDLAKPRLTAEGLLEGEDEKLKWFLVLKMFW